MMKWFIGVSSALFLALCGWSWTFVLMGYQAQADVSNLKQFAEISRHEQGGIEAEVKTIREISLRTEKNTEQIREYLLKRAIPVEK